MLPVCVDVCSMASVSQPRFRCPLVIPAWCVRSSRAGGHAPRVLQSVRGWWGLVLTEGCGVLSASCGSLQMIPAGIPCCRRTACMPRMRAPLRQMRPGACRACQRDPLAMAPAGPSCSCVWCGSCGWCPSTRSTPGCPCASRRRGESAGCLPPAGRGSAGPGCSLRRGLPRIAAR